MVPVKMHTWWSMYNGHPVLPPCAGGISPHSRSMRCAIHQKYVRLIGMQVVVAPADARCERGILMSCLITTLFMFMTP